MVILSRLKQISGWQRLIARKQNKQGVQRQEMLWLEQYYKEELPYLLALGDAMAASLEQF